MGIERRLEKLEANATRATSEWVVPIEVRVLTKAVARHQAREEGKEPPPYTQEEIEEMRRDDQEVASGGVVGWFREGAGWRSEEARAKLDEWQKTPAGGLNERRVFRPSDGGHAPHGGTIRNRRWRPTPESEGSGLWSCMFIQPRYMWC